MTIEIRALDATRPETPATLIPVFRAGMAADAPLHPTPTTAFLKYAITPRLDQTRTCVAAFDDGVPIGYSSLNCNFFINKDLVFGDVWILPERRADAVVPLLEAFKAHARAHGAKRLLNGCTEAAAADYAPMFTAAGGRKVDAERRSQVDLATIDREQYAAWAAPSEKNAPYRIRTWLLPTPPDVLPALVKASEAMNDAPLEIDFEHPPPDVGRRRRNEDLMVAMGVRKRVIAAFTDDGEIAGVHETMVIPGYRMAEVDTTAVPGPFRGHGLGLRLKADTALRLLAEEPGVDMIGTWNNTGNAPMLRVNETLGYGGAEVWETWQFDL